LRYLWGEGTPVDYPLALSYARQSSHPAALLTLSRALHFGLGTPRDRDAAVRLRRKALPALEHFSEQGSGVASFCLAHAFLSTRPPDPVTARAYFEKALQQGCPLARAPLGHLLLEAHPSNPARGLELLQEAAREHSAQAARHLATFHRIQGDAANEMRQLQAGAQLLDPHSLVSLGLLRANQGSASEAARLFQRALHQWDEFGEAQTLLGFCFLRGAGVPRDPKRAFELATRATVNGGAESCLILAQLCETGQAATQDYEAAYIWASIAVARGCSDPHSIALRNRLEERLPPADRAKAQARALQLLQELEKQLPRDP
jgi:TPR repeat protein